MSYGHYDLTLSTEKIYTVEDLSYMYGISEIGIMVRVHHGVNRDSYVINLDDDKYQLVFANKRDLARIEYLMNLDVDNDCELVDELATILDLFYELFNFVRRK